MFTGLIESVGTVDSVTGTAAGLELRITCDYEDLRTGESVAVNGACLTVRTCEPGRFTAAAIVTTIGRTTIGHWQQGRRVNLERALRVGDRLGGHLLQGHVDCVGTITEISRRVDALLVALKVPEDTWELLAPLGSIAIDGVSLTVNDLASRGEVQVALIEHTLTHTTLNQLATGDHVHVEADILGKHVRHLLAPYITKLAAEVK